MTPTDAAPTPSAASDRRPILVLTASAGSGHNMAAEALAQVLRAQPHGRPVVVHDLLQSTNLAFRKLYAQGYLGIVNHVPLLMGVLYDTLDREPGPSDRLRQVLQNISSNAAGNYVCRQRPALILNTHFYPAEVVARLRRRGRLNCPQVTVTTDFETHRLWVHEPTERYYTATSLGASYLATWGVPADRLRVTGIPIRPAFAQRRTDASVRAALQLPADRPVILLLSGGLGVGPTQRIFEELAPLSARAQLVVIAGRNEQLRQRLAATATTAAPSARVIGYTEEIHDWMTAADLLVSKPGGLTASEALACGAALAVFNPIPGQEFRNSDYLLENGAAIKINHIRLLRSRIEALLAEPARLASLRAAAVRLARPAAAAEIVADALTLLPAPDRPH